ncbi:MAG: hypothetical protein J6Z04_03435 [Clostridia bacterium]|nr:hypothetical protein [Clostridia bacterium]
MKERQKPSALDPTGFVLLSEYVPDAVQRSAITPRTISSESGSTDTMGGVFDFPGGISHPDYRGITEDQYENRMLLRHIMTQNGFQPIDCERWHFCLTEEPYPDTYFVFPVSSVYLK